MKSIYLLIIKFVSVGKIGRALYACITIALLFSSLQANSQSPCDKKTDYGQWIVLKEWGCLPTPCRTAITFKPGICNGNSICGYGLRWKFLNEHLEKEAYIKLKFNYKTCGGEIKTSEEMISLDKTGITEGAGNFTSGLGYEVVGAPYDIVYVPSRNTQTLSTAKGDFNKSIITFDNNYNQVNTSLARLTNAPQRTEAQNKLTAYRNSFNSLKTTAQQNTDQQNGNALAQNVGQLNQLNKDVLNLMNDYREGTPNPATKPSANNIQNINTGTSITANKNPSNSGNTPQKSAPKTGTTSL